jgi:transposase
VTDRQWALVEGLLPNPPPGPAGRPPRHEKRQILNAILYLTRTGCSWRMLPKDFPPWQTVYGYFRDWTNDDTLQRLHDSLREQVRAKEGRNTEPSAGIVDSQSLKGADTVPRESRGYDAGKKINGRKRHIVVDTIGLLLIVMVTAASVQDRAGGESILDRLHGALRPVRHIFADGGYSGELVKLAKRSWKIVVEIVKTSRADRVRRASSQMGSRENVLLADALAPPGTRLRAPTRDPQSTRPSSHDRPHAQPPRTPTRTTTLELKETPKVN